MSINEITDSKDQIDFIKSKIISIESVFEDKEKIILDKEKIEKFLNGVKLSYNLQERSL